MTSADFCVFSNTLQYWLLLSERITQTSPGTTRFLLSIHLPHLSCMIPCSYGALTCSAALPSCMTSYVISVRQTRDLPMSSYIPHIQLPSDSTSRWTPLPSAISFPLPGGLGTCTLWKRAPPGAHSKKEHPFSNRCSQLFSFSTTNFTFTPRPPQSEHSRRRLFVPFIHRSPCHYLSS